MIIIIIVIILFILLAVVVAVLHTSKRWVARNMMQFPWVGLLEVPQKPQLKPDCVSLPSVATAVEVKLPRQPKQIETKHTASTINFI